MGHVHIIIGFQEIILRLVLGGLFASLSTIFGNFICCFDLSILVLVDFWNFNAYLPLSSIISLHLPVIGRCLLWTQVPDDVSLLNCLAINIG